MSNLNIQLCSNCDTPINDKYCSKCGQKIKDYQPSLNNFILALWDDFVSVDAKLLNTLKALFKPGRLTLDWVNGKQQRYVHPVRLYIILSILYSTLMFVGFEGGLHVYSFVSGFIEGMIDGNKHNITKDQINQLIQLTTFLILPLTIISATIYSLKDKLIKHIFFVINIYSVIAIFSIAALIIINALKPFGIELPSLYLMPPLTLIFTLLSAKTVYEKGFIEITIKTLFVFIVNFILIVSISGISFGFLEAENEHLEGHEDAEIQKETPISETESNTE